MPCYGTVTPSDLREPTIEIVCERCARRERYSVASLIAAPGTDAKLSGCCPVFCCGRVAAELLAKQSLDIGLVVNDENERFNGPLSVSKNRPNRREAIGSRNWSNPARSRRRSSRRAA